MAHRITTAHGEIAWDHFGDGPPVVLVHGRPSRSVLWRNIAPLLADRHSVYALDLLGFDQWEGELGQRLWLRNVRGFDEQDTLTSSRCSTRCRHPPATSEASRTDGCRLRSAPG
ncbi:MAG: hypothetical protein DLM59_04390 [Pseudonocardiales bacterium]|nr:MAG: hypothetical protein DLM59_04390 [Pseudonocardiales bacterium]